MNADHANVMQYLKEAEASERTLVRVLQSQITMTPRGSYRSALETHLDCDAGGYDAVTLGQDLRGRHGPYGCGD